MDYLFPFPRLRGLLFRGSLPWCAMLLIILLLPACSSENEKPKSKPAVPVTVATAVRKTVPVQIRVIGNVEAYATVSIKSQVNGMIEKVNFREGQDVKKGQLLFSIDSRPFAAALRQARAALARDAAQERFAREQVRRYGELLNDGIVTRDQYDQLRANADALGETVRADRAVIDNAEIQLGYCSIRSPIDGRTGNLLVQQGNLVKANDVPVLVTINQVNPIYVTFSVPEKSLAEIKRYMAGGQLKVEAVIPNVADPAEQGVVSFIDNMVDTTTGTIKIKGTFANRERRLWPGQFVDVALTLTSLPDVVVVPAQAVQTGQSGQFIFVVKADRSVAVRPVVTGETYQGEVVVVKGIGPGETVVTDGQMQLVPGAKVQIKSAKPGPQVPRT
jgi:multidrug efflux system membrane fusion protein